MSQGDSSIYFRAETYDTGDGHFLDYDETSKIAMKEMLECFVGVKIGNGYFRDVFLCRHDPSLVVKIEKGFSQQNATEVAIWESVKDNFRVNRWLAPITARSSSNRVIVQKRTTPLIRAPKKLPGFLNDTKPENYGMLDGRIVCHDYGLISRFNKIDTKLVTIDWFDQFERTKNGF